MVSGEHASDDTCSETQLITRIRMHITCRSPTLVPHAYHMPITRMLVPHAYHMRMTCVSHAYHMRMTCVSHAYDMRMTCG